MITITKNQLKQVEYLINQSLQGNHILFGIDDVRSVFTSEWFATEPSGMSEDEAYAMEHHIERILLEPTLEEKRAYISRLDQITFRKVVKTYFIILENNLFENQGVYH